MDESSIPSAPAPPTIPAGLEPKPQPESPLLHPVFIGPEGLRAPWRLLLYYVLFKALGWAISEVMGFLIPARTGFLRLALLGEFDMMLAAIMAAVCMARLEKRSFSDYGLPLRRALSKTFWVGALWGLAAITLLLAALHGFHVFDFGHVVLHGAKVWKFAAFWAFFFLLVGLYEEFHFRGYPQFTLTKALSPVEGMASSHALERTADGKLTFWAAAVALSVAFGWIHRGNTGENLVGMISAALIGLFFCLTLRRTGDLWFAVGFHASWDWGQSFLYSVPDSGSMVPGHLLSSSLHGPAWLTGGTVGPEGSVLVFVIIALLWIAFDRLHPEVKYRL